MRSWVDQNQKSKQSAHLYAVIFSRKITAYIGFPAGAKKIAIQENLKDKKQTLPLLKKWQTPKTPIRHWAYSNVVGIPKQGGNNLSYQLLKFPSLRFGQTFTVDTSPLFTAHNVKAKVRHVEISLYSFLRHYPFFVASQFR